MQAPRALVRDPGDACHRTEGEFGPRSPARRALCLVPPFPPLPLPAHQICHSRCPSVGNAQPHLGLGRPLSNQSSGMWTSLESLPWVMCWMELRS